jgi:hypothetical protein
MTDDENEGTSAIADAIKLLANAITPLGSIPGHDGYVHVDSLTEAVMGATHALTRIGDQLEGIKDLLELEREEKS